MATFPLKPAAGRNLGVTYKLAKLPQATPCLPTPLTVGWFTESTGQFSEASEAAYLLPEPDTIGGPVLAVAGLIGNPCAEVQWVTSWDAGSGNAPGIYQDDQRLVVYPVAGMSPGLLTAWAVVSGRRYGPIVLTVLRYECAGYGYGYGAGCIMALDPLTWDTGSVDETAIAYSEYGFSAAVSGAWPAGTAFDWVIDDGIDLGTLIMNNAIAVFYNGYGGAGYLEATVTVTTPDGVAETLGPITLTVTSGGCC